MLANNAKNVVQGHVPGGHPGFEVCLWGVLLVRFVWCMVAMYQWDAATVAIKFAKCTYPYFHHLFRISLPNALYAGMPISIYHVNFFVIVQQTKMSLLRGMLLFE